MGREGNAWRWSRVAERERSADYGSAGTRLYEVRRIIRSGLHGQRNGYHRKRKGRV